MKVSVLVRWVQISDLFLAKYTVIRFSEIFCFYVNHTQCQLCESLSHSDISFPDKSDTDFKY